MLRSDFVDQNIGKLLKGIGFDVKCMMSMSELSRVEQTTNLVGSMDWNNEIGEHYSIPSWQQTFDWFRTKHKLEGVIFRSTYRNSWQFEIFEIMNVGKSRLIGGISHTSYDYARSECIEALIEAVRKEQEV